MQQQISENTIHSWASSFVKTLQQPVPGTLAKTRLLRAALRDSMIRDFNQARKRLILLDYDGTLVPFKENFKETKPSKKIINLMQKLIDNPANNVVVISGRQAADLDEWFHDLELNLVGEHGAVVKKALAKKWKTLEHVNTEWKKVVLPILERYTAITPHALIEIKPHSLVWHYRAAPAYTAQKNSVILKRVLKPTLKKYGIQIFQGNKILEIKDPRVNKGSAVKPWLHQNYDLVLAIGDDYTDEDLFACLANSAYTIKVGPGRTNASYRLKTVDEVVDLLRQLSHSH